MNPTLRKCLEALSLRQSYCQQKRDDDLSHQSKNLDKEQLLQSKTADTHSQAMQFDKDHKVLQEQDSQFSAPVDNLEDTPIVPYVPVKPRECQAYYDMNTSMRKYLCDRCDKLGNVKYMGGMIGKCMRFKT